MVPTLALCLSLRQNIEPPFKRRWHSPLSSDLQAFDEVTGLYSTRTEYGVLDLHSGKPLWRKSRTGFVLQLSPQGNLLIEKDKISTINPQTGQAHALLPNHGVLGPVLQSSGWFAELVPGQLAGIDLYQHVAWMVTLRGGPTRPGHSTLSGPPISVSPDAIVAPLKNGEVVAFERGTGKERWRIRGFAAQRVCLAMRVPYTLILNGRGLVAGIDARTGKEMWRRRVGDGVWGEPLCSGDSLDFVSQAGVVTRIGLPGGEVMWQTPLGSKTVWPNDRRAATHTEQDLFLMTTAGHVVRLEGSAGRIVWKTDLPAGYRFVGFGSWAPPPSGDFVPETFLSRKGTLLALNRKGSPIWSMGLADPAGVATLYPKDRGFLLAGPRAIDLFVSDDEGS